MAGHETLFIVIEGIGGCGKNTQLELLEDFLEGKGIRAAIVHDPGTTPCGIGLRKLLLDGDVEMSPREQTLLYTAARASLTDYIGELRRGGLSVLCGRWMMSTLVYQGMIGKVGTEAVYQLHRQYVRLDPDVYVLLDLPAETAHTRLYSEREDASESLGAPGAPELHPQNDRWESRGVEFLNDLRRRYLLCAEDMPNAWIVNGADDPNVVFEDVLEACALKSERFAEIAKGYHERGLK